MVTSLISMMRYSCRNVVHFQRNLLRRETLYVPKNIKGLGDLLRHRLHLLVFSVNLGVRSRSRSPSSTASGSVVFFNLSLLRSSSLLRLLRELSTSVVFTSTSVFSVQAVRSRSQPRLLRFRISATASQISARSQSTSASTSVAFFSRLQPQIYVLSHEAAPDLRSEDFHSLQLSSATDLRGPLLRRALLRRAVSSATDLRGPHINEHHGGISAISAPEYGFQHLKFQQRQQDKAAAVMSSRSSATSLIPNMSFTSPFVDGSIVSPPMHLLQASSAPVLNPDYFQWQQIYHMIRSWNFVILSRDILMKVMNLQLTREIRDRLHQRFMSTCMTRSMELKRKLTSLRKALSNSMEKYLRDIKIFVDLFCDQFSTIEIPPLCRGSIAPGFCGYPCSFGDREKFKGGRSSQLTSGRGSFPGQVSRPCNSSKEQSRGILGYRSTSVSERSGFCGCPRSFGDREKFKGGRSSQLTSGRDSFSGQVSRPCNLQRNSPKGSSGTVRRRSRNIQYLPSVYRIIVLSVKSVITLVIPSLVLLAMILSLSKLLRLVLQVNQTRLKDVVSVKDISTGRTLIQGLNKGRIFFIVTTSPPYVSRIPPSIALVVSVTPGST
ncbi:hypothetical protein AKJ16_DCAP12532 [Drosera capensis]